ncbi:MAG: TraR/DksA family transcriptional regulator [Burkholderiales bacterium]
MSRITNKQLEKFRNLLDRKEALLREEIAQRQANASVERGARASADGTMDPADEASADSLTDTHIAMMNHYEQELHDIESARVRMESGFYGSCTDCGADIGVDRLTVYPTAKRCIVCQNQREKTYSSKAA